MCAVFGLARGVIPLCCAQDPRALRSRASSHTMATVFLYSWGKMSIPTFLRCGVTLFLVALAAGCSSGPGKSSSLLNACTWNRSSCLYEGSYEPDEEEYAEEEARRLNKAQIKRLQAL